MGCLSCWPAVVVCVYANQVSVQVCLVCFTLPLPCHSTQSGPISNFFGPALSLSTGLANGKLAKRGSWLSIYFSFSFLATLLLTSGWTVSVSNDNWPAHLGHLFPTSSTSCPSFFFLDVSRHQRICIRLWLGLAQWPDIGKEKSGPVKNQMEIKTRSAWARVRSTPPLFLFPPLDYFLPHLQPRMVPIRYE